MPRSDPPPNLSRFIFLASLCLVVAALYFAAEILVPLALAILLSFLLAPLVHRLERLRLPRVAAVGVTVILAFGLLGGIGYVLYNQLTDLTNHLPEYRGNIQAKVDSFRNGQGFFRDIAKAGHEVSTILAPPSSQPATTQRDPHASSLPTAIAPAPLEKPQPVVVTNLPEPSTSTSSSESPWQLVESVGGRILGPVGTAFLVIILTIFMLLQREDLRDRFIRLLGRGQLPVTTQAIDDAADRVSEFLRAQSILNGSEGVVVMICLWIIGHFNGRPFPNPALWGLLAALLRFVPYIGIWLAAIMPIALSLAVYSSAKVALETAGAYIGIEIIVANAIEPYFLGSRTGMAPIAVLVSATFWTWLWGPVGLLLSTPITVCLVVIGKYVPPLEFLDILLGDEPALRPPARVYQRLLALDEEEAEELVREYEQKMPLEQLYDEVLLPAVAMSQWDRHHGHLDDERLEFIRSGFRDLIEQTAERHQSKVLAEAAKNTVQEARGEPPAPPALAREAVGPTTTPAAPAQPRAAGRFYLPKNCIINVAALPAHKEDDELAALMFARLLEMRGYCVTILSNQQLASEMLQVVEQNKIDAICISALSPGATAHARYLCKRLHSRFPELPGVVGLWNARFDLERAKNHIGCADRVQVVASLRDALVVMHQLIQPRLMQQNASDGTTLQNSATKP